MKKVVIGYDGTAKSKDALCFGRMLARATSSTLYVACIFEDQPLFGDVQGQEAERDQAIKRLFDDAARELDSRAFEEYTATGSAAEGLSATAHGIDADLIVVGSSHQGKLGRIYPGSVGERLLNGTGCAVAVVPREFAQRPEAGTGTIGVAFDGRKESEEALVFAVELAEALDATLRLIAVVTNEFNEEPSGDDAAFLQSLRHKISERVAEAEERLPEDLNFGAVIEEGDPVEVLAERSADVDLMVVGSRAYGPVGYAILGGISHPLMRVARSPVIVVPKGVGKPAGETEPVAV